MPQSIPSDNAAIVAFNVALSWCAWVFTYTGMPMEPSSILGALMLIDFFTGVGKAYVLQEPITPRRGARGSISKLGLLLVPLVVALAAKAVGGDLLWLVKFTITTLVLTESYSILVNIRSIKTGEALPKLDAVTLILERIRRFIEQYDPREK